MKLLLTIALMLSSTATHADSRIAVGKPFPVLPLPLAGKQDHTASIMDYRGDKLMLHLFASW